MIWNEVVFEKGMTPTRFSLWCKPLRKSRELRTAWFTDILCCSCTFYPGFSW